MRRQSIKKAEFYDKAPKEVDIQVRINHDKCPAGADTRSRLYITRKSNGSILCYCHNCGNSGYVPPDGTKKRLSIEEIKREILEVDERELEEEIVYPEGSFPIGVKEKWTAEARAWLYRHQFTDKMIFDWGINYCPSMDRVILPIFDTGKMMMWQGRSVSGEPKYITKKKKGYVPFSPYKWTESVVICEDLLSKIRLNVAGFPAIALCGTHMHDETIKDLMHIPKDVYLWLDDDGPGRDAAKTIFSKLSIYKIPTTVLIHKEPKKCSDEEIREVLRGF